MKLYFTNASRNLLAASIVASLLGWGGSASAQQAMDGMPGMAPTPTPTPKKAAASPTKSPGEASSDMKDMPGMSAPTQPTVAPKPSPNPVIGQPTPQGKKEMDAMPGMATPAQPSQPPTPAAKAQGDGASTDMKDMPGMGTPTPSPRPPKGKPGPPGQTAMEAMPGMEAPAKTAKAAQGTKMEDMPGMGPKKTAGKKDPMSNMPGMAGSESKKKDSMSGMPGMGGNGSKKKGSMSGMPGMPANGAPENARMSAPGVTILGPHRKWNPPKGDNRAAELLSQPMLDQHMKDLPPPVEDKKTHTFVLFDLLEYRAYNRGSPTFSWDVVGWIGGDYNRLWVKTEGDLNLRRGNGVQGDLQLLYGRLIAPFWDLQTGVRFNGITGPQGGPHSRGYFVLGLQGMAPGRFSLEPALYVSNRGEVSAELTASADLYLTQRWVMQPRLEVQASVQGDRQFQTGPGLNQTDLGVRFRYEIRREFAPYIGVTWQRKYGRTAAISRADGEPADAVAFVLGLQVWF